MDENRGDPLPITLPKPPDDDPEAPARIQALLESSAYVLPEKDEDLMALDDLRAVRLQLEYLKAELSLVRHGIRSTIVVFGGTRIVEEKAARRRLAELESEHAKTPDDAELARRLSIARRVLAKSKYYDVARELGRLVSRDCQTNHECDFVIATGGGPGIMEAANRGAYDVGAKSVGLNITLPLEQFPNPYITPELCFQFRYFALRKLHFLKRAKALVACPGGYGTFDELFEALCLVQTHKIAPLPIVLVGEEFWRNAFDAEFLAAEGVISPKDVSLFRYAETAEETWAHIRDWYRDRSGS